MSKSAAVMSVTVALLSAALVAEPHAMAAPSGGDMPAARPPTAAAQKDKKQGNGLAGNWLTSFNHATGQARKDDRLIMAYFRGSDWCDYCRKLDKEVLNTPMFAEWAGKNVVLLEIDFPSDKRQSPSQKKHNDAMKDRYGVVKTPTFVFMDADGEPITRCGYDTAKLRENEAKGEPKAFIEYLTGVVRDRPRKQQVIALKTLDEGLKASKQHGLPLLLLITQGDSEDVVQKSKELLANQKFVRFVNTHMAFVRIAWPKDDDYSLAALEFLAWAHKRKIPPLPLQLVVWDPARREVTARVTSLEPQKIDPVLLRLREVLPNIDYGGRWIEDFRLAQSIAAQTGRDILMAYISSDGSEWSQRMDKEIFQTEEFKNYARKNLVLLRLDFPRNVPQTEKLKEQNRLLAEAHGVRGYPTVIFLNPRGQKFGQARYMKGGPKAFLESLQQLRNADYDRRTILSDQFKVDDVTD